MAKYRVLEMQREQPLLLLFHKGTEPPPQYGLPDQASWCRENQAGPVE